MIDLNKFKVMIVSSPGVCLIARLKKDTLPSHVGSDFTLWKIQCHGARGDTVRIVTRLSFLGFNHVNMSIISTPKWDDPTIYYATQRYDLIDWLIDCLIDWLIDLIDWFDWLIDW
jgi:hypothetical protein